MCVVHSNGFLMVEKLTKLHDILKDYYLPCKGKKYLGDLDEKKCITLLRQFIRIHDYKCISREKSIKGRKTMTYRLLYSKDDYLKSPQTKVEKAYILSFE